MSVRTLCEIYRRGVLEQPRAQAASVASPGRPLHGELSAAEVARAVERLYHFWIRMGARRGERCLLWMANRPEWAIADFSLLAAGLPSVPLYLTLGREEVRAVLENCRPRFAVVGSAELARRLEEAGDGLQPQTVVSLDATPGAVSWSEALERGEERRRSAGGAEFPGALAAASPGDTATLIYTSGTTGTPKGVPLSHGNITSNVLACLQVIDLGPGDVALSFLPLCHTYERLLDYCYWYVGARRVYVPDPRTVADVLAIAAPSALGAVPRFYEKLLERILERGRAAGGWRRRLLEWGMKAGLERLALERGGAQIPAGARLRHLAARLLVQRRVRAALGGRLRLMISGGAPLAAETGETLEALGLKIIQGYGLTETSPVLTLNPPGRNRHGTVGPPLPGTEIRIGADGEVLARGPGVFAGYYNAPEETREIFVDGWFATGDQGHLEADGYLVISGRKKEIIVTAGGKKIAPAFIEKRLESDPLISQAALIGDNRQFLSALVVPDFAALERELRGRGLPGGDRQALVRRPEVCALYEQRVAALLADRASFEQVRRVALVAEEWTPESGLLTPTLKVRRNRVLERYRDRIDALYAAPPAASAAGARVEEERRI
jgi:long-chain acyl-CoA synthetase